MFGLTEFQLFAWTVGILGPIAALAVATRYYVKTQEHEDEQRRFDLAKERLRETNAPESPALSAAREKFRDGGTTGYGGSRGMHPALGAPYGTTRPRGFAAKPPARNISFTPRQLERVNHLRRLQGKPRLNLKGFRAAVATAASEPRRQPDTSSDWLTYFILYETFFTAHTGPVSGGITIIPDAPFNGQGGEYAGAGASGQWTAPDAPTASAAAAIDTRTAFTTDAPDGKYAPGDTVGGYASGGYVPADPSPVSSYTPVDPSPASSYTPPARDPDPSSSYSAPASDPSPSYTPSAPSDSGSSSPSSPDTGSSGGGDGS